MEQQPAVLDRIEDGGLAVLLVGEAQEEWVVPVERLPAGAVPGSWLQVGLEGDVLEWVELNPGATDEARARIAQKLERLRRRGRRTGGSPGS